VTSVHVEICDFRVAFSCPVAPGLCAPWFFLSILVRWTRFYFSGAMRLGSRFPICDAGNPSDVYSSSHPSFEPKLLGLERCLEVLDR